MQAPKLFFSYRETRLDLDSSNQGSTVSIRLPTAGFSSSFSKDNNNRSTPPNNLFAEDEISFRQKHLASASSVYYRNYPKSPKNFLWRVLEDGKVLSIQVVDVSTKSIAADKFITLRIIFPHSILPSCLAISDSKEHDVLSVFVLTESKQVWTLSLRSEFFRRAPNTDENSVEWFSVFSPKSLGIKIPHRLVALSVDELLVSFHDGALVRLYRDSGDLGSSWKEQQYNEGGWSHSFRSMVPFQISHGIPYQNHRVQPSAATGIASPGTTINGIPFVFTITVDHRLRIWNLLLGKIAYTGDILTQETELPDEPKKIIDPSYSQLVKIILNNNKDAVCITFSPIGLGEFKFWNILVEEDGNLDLIDLFPEIKLVPPAPSSDIWTIADFSVSFEQNIAEKLNLWILWKNNVTYRLHRVDFTIDSISDVKSAWNGFWKAATLERIHENHIPTILPCDPCDATDKWLEFILFPGRFTIPTIETALAIYEQGLGSTKDATHKSKSLPERLCTAIASTAILARISDGSMGFSQFRSTTHTQWMRFYRLLIDLDKLRGEAMSLLIDPENGMPWVALADGISAIRHCSALEKAWHNNMNGIDESNKTSPLIFAAAHLRESLPENFVHACKSMLLDVIHLETSVTDITRMHQLYEKCDFSNQVGDEEYHELLNNLGGHFKDVTPNVYNTIIDLMSPSDDPYRGPLVAPLADLGNQLIVKGVQEIVELHLNICLEQLILLTFIENEVNHEEEGTNFATAPIFHKFTSILSRLELVHWLLSTQLSLPLWNIENSSLNQNTENSNLEKKPSVVTRTVFEGVLRHLFSLDLKDGEEMPSVVTEVLVQICAANSAYEAPPAVIQCYLLKYDRPDLAMEFSKFAGRDAFSTYIQGRSYLAVGDALTAAGLFMKAAYGLAFPNPKKRSSDHRSAGYLSESEKCLLNAGLSKYYSHIVALYEKEKLYSFVIDFARLSLQFIDVDAGEKRVQTDMLNLLYLAAMQTARYELAYTTLTLFTNSALQYSSLYTLITGMCESSNATKLISLPFIGLQDKVDDILSEKCRGIVDFSVGIPYHKILYAWRIKRGDFRGAAAILLQRLIRLQQSGDGDGSIDDDETETPLIRQYVSLINALSCVDPKQAWVLSDESPPWCQDLNATVNPGRNIVTLSDVRKGYQEELDRIAAIQNNQIVFAGGDEMDVL
ncbi:Nucleoporin [Podosphaera aphanis]|nr:Nucleoporin [Podosphaera aphanis]